MAGYSLGFGEYRFSKGEMIDYLNQAGFKILQVDYSDLNPPRSMTLILDGPTTILSRRGPSQDLNLLGRIVVKIPWLFPLSTYYSNVRLDWSEEIRCLSD